MSNILEEVLKISDWCNKEFVDYCINIGKKLYLTPNVSYVLNKSVKYEYEIDSKYMCIEVYLDKSIHIYKKFPCGRSSLRVLKEYIIDDLNKELSLFMSEI